MKSKQINANTTMHYLDNYPHIYSYVTVSDGYKYISYYSGNKLIEFNIEEIK